MKRICILFLTCVALHGLAQQTTFRVQYNFNQFDIPGGLVQAPSGNYIFPSAVVSGFSIPIGPKGGLTEIDQNGNHVRSTLYNNGLLTTSVEFTDVKNAGGGGYVVTGDANSQCFLAKIPVAFGTPTWQYRYVPVSGASASGSKVIQTSDGGFLVAGSANHLSNGTAMTDSSKMFALKVDASGNVLWSKVFFYSTTFDDDDYLNAVTEVSDGYVFVGSVTTSFNGSSRGAVIKTDVSGNVQWGRQIGANDIQSVITDSGNDIVMAGLDGAGGYIYNWNAPNFGPSVIGTNTKYTAAGLGVSVGSLSKTFDNNFAVFVSGATITSFTTIIVKANRSTGAVMFAKSYNSFISILPVGIQTVDSGFLMNSLSADTAGGGGYDFGVTKTDITGSQGSGSSCPASNPPIVTQNYTPGINAFTPVAVGTGVRSSGGTTAVNSTPGVVINCRTIACTPPATPTVTSSGNNTCPGAPVTISASGGTNVTYHIYTQASGGTSIGNAPFSVSPITTTTYYTEADDNSNPGCVSSRASVTVTVIQPPANVGVITGSTNPCVGSQNYSIAPVSGAVSYAWTLSGGGTITGSGTSATVNWTAAGGPYTLTVTASNTCGTKTNTLTVNVLPAVSSVLASAIPNPACAGGTLTLNGAGSNVTTWSWTGPLGFSASTQDASRPNLLTTHSGTYTLNASNSCGSASSSVVVAVNDVPQAVSASANPNPACVGNTLLLSGSATGANSWSWSGPNSFTASTQTLSISNAQTNATGTYTLTATNACGNSTATVNVAVNNVPQNVTATANNANPNSVCPGAALNLSGSATGAVSYSWTGPNGFISSQINNTINNFQAANAGTYTLTATNTCGTAQSPVTVSISSGPVSTTATANLTNICSNATLTLTGSSIGATSWGWTGPNAFTSTLQSPGKPNVTLADSGLYTLTAANVCGTATASVNVDVDNPIQNLSANAAPNDTVCAGATINLNASGTQVNTWNWSGPGGYTSSQQNAAIPNSTAANNGTYTLTASNACGSSTATISVLVNNAIQNFSANATSNGVVCTESSVTLSATGTNVNGWSWTGANGFTSAQQNPIINPATTINSGVYTLTAYNACGNQTASVTLQVDTLIQNLTSSALPNDTICAGGTLNLNAAGTNVTSWSWTGPNNFASAQQNTSVPNATTAASGIYTITASNACGNSIATISVLVNDAIAGLAATSGTGAIICNNNTIALNASGTNVNNYSWTGPNGFVSSEQNPSVSNATVAASGTYTVAANNACGSQTATVSIEVDTVIENLASAASPDDTICEGNTLNLNASGTNVNTWNWTGPNGFTSAQQNPSIASAVTANSGDYIVAASNACGSVSDTISVLVNAIPGKPSIIIGSLTICGNDTTTYSVPAVPNATAYNWTLSGSGTIVSGQGTTSVNVSWGATAGSYDLSVTASNSCGASAASSITVNLQAPVPVMNSIIVGDTGVCPGVQPYSVNNIPNSTSYTWTIDGGGTISNGQGTNAVNVNWTIAGTHTVSVIATNTCGNSSAASLNVNVHPSPTTPTINLVNNTTTICEGSSTTITATNSVGGVVLYNFFDAATDGNLVGSNPLTVSPVVTTVYYLEVINEFGCTSSAGRIPVTVNVTKAPTVLGIDASGDSVCYNSTAVLTANVVPAGTVVSWYLDASGGTEIGTGVTYTTGALTQTTTYYAQATSTGGCQNLQGRVPSTVTVIPLPVVILTSDKDHNTIFPNEVIMFTALPDSLDNYEFFWNAASVQTGSSNTWSSSKMNGLDSVWVIATNSGCIGARSLDTIHVVDFPNAFTPNNDGVNDLFLNGYQLLVTNRWGQTLYEGREGWDGRYKGEKVSPGTYYYIVTLDNITDRKNAIKGTVLLIED